MKFRNLFFSSLIFVIFLSSVSFSQDYMMMGVDKIAKKNYKGAIEDLLKAVDRTPRNTKAHFYLGEAYFLDEQIDLSEKSLRRSVELDDENVQATKRLGDILLLKNVKPDALKYFLLALKFDKRNPDILLAIGKVLIELDSLDRAQTVLFQTRDINPKNIDVYLALGNLYLKMNVPSMAMDNFKKVSELDNQNPEAHLKLGDILFREARRSGDPKMAREAINEYIKGVEIDSTNKKILYKVSHTLFINRMFERAANYYKKYVALVDTSYQAFWELGASLQKFKPLDLDLSVKTLSKATKLNVRPVDAYRNLSYAYYLKQEFKNAVSAYIELEKIDSLSLDEYDKLARSSLGAKDTLNAIKYFETTIKIDPDHDVYGELATLYTKLGKYKEAGNNFWKKALSDTSSNRWKWFMYAGSFRSASSDLDGAREAYLNALDVKDTSIIHFYLGQVYQNYPKSDSMKLAVEEYKTFTDLAAGKEKEYKAQFESSYRVIGLYYYSKKDYQGALDYITKALRFNEKNRDLGFLRAACVAQLGNKEEACKLLKDLAEKFPKDKDIAEMRKKLQCYAYD